MQQRTFTGFTAAHSVLFRVASPFISCQCSAFSHSAGCAQAASAAKVAADAVKDAKPAAESAKQDAKQAARDTAAAVQEAAPAAPKEAVKDVAKDAKEAGGDLMSLLSAAVKDAAPPAPREAAQVAALPLLDTPLLADGIKQNCGKSPVRLLSPLGQPGSESLRVLFGLLRRLETSVSFTCTCTHADSHI